jgi:hypothetical protein
MLLAQFIAVALLGVAFDPRENLTLVALWAVALVGSRTSQSMPPGGGGQAPADAMAAYVTGYR